MVVRLLAPIEVIKCPDGEHILKEPFDLTIDDEDNLYVCDAGNRRIIIFKERVICNVTGIDHMDEEEA
jgi:hypothetical protein